jgi:hypothetical protein
MDRVPTSFPQGARVDNKNVDAQVEVSGVDQLLSTRTTAVAGTGHDVITTGEGRSRKGEVSGTSAV